MKRKKRFLVMLALFAFVLTTTACGSNDEAGGQDTIYAEGGGTQWGGEEEKDDHQKRNGESGLPAEDGGTQAGENQDDGAQEGLKDQTGGGTEEAAAPQRQPIDLTVWDAYAVILNGCSRELICGYVIDEAFLAWVTTNYGTDMIFALAEAVEARQAGTQPDTPETQPIESDLWYQLTGNSIHVLWSLYCKESGYQNHYLERVYWKECANTDQIVLDFIGDINFAEGWSSTRYLDQQVDGLYDCFSADLLAELNQADIMMVNNEFTYSTRGEPVEGKDYVFRADPDRVYLLEIMGTDIVSLANNHAYDYGPEALLDTMETLNEAQIPYVGAGANLEEAEKPSYFIANGKKIAIVSATQVERTLNYTKEATETEPGVLKTLNPEKFVAVIKEAKKNADYVIVYVHWGTEQNPYFERDQEELADAYIEAGADAIIGGHTHCLQGCEYRNGVPIIYSLGNFWFNSNKLDTGIAQLVIRKDGNIDFRFLPCIQKRNQTYLVTEEQEKQRILDYMESISSGVEFDEDGYMAERQ